MTRRQRVELPTILRDRWRLGRPLGEGGQGQVYLLHPVSGEPNAVIKFLLTNTTYYIERFRREVGALARLKHPNVLPIIEHGMEPVPFYVAPKGDPLNEYWSAIRLSCGASDLFDRSARIIEQLAQGLAAVHEIKLVHRDIKPANVIVFAEDTPVLADFGIVFDPDAERITTRPAGNKFARDLASFYDPTLAPPEGDCLCLANLWAWMLASAPQLRHGNYHWRFHRFIDDERCDIARAVLALCSEPSACPKDGRAFVELLVKRFSLLTLTSSAAEGAAPKKAYAIAAAENDTAKVALRSEMEVLALAILPQLGPLVSTLRDAGRTLRAQSLPVNLHVLGLSDPLAHADVLGAILSTEKERIPHRMAAVTCGDDSVTDFGVTLHVEWHNNPHEDRSKFAIHIYFFHEDSPEVHQLMSRYYKVLPNGDIEGFEAEAVAARVREFFEDPKMWRPRTKPRHRPPGAFLG